MAMRVPSADIATELPDESPAASPSMSVPVCVQAVPLHEYMRTWPASMPLPSLLGAPMAMRLPSADIATELPAKSPAASPSMSVPVCVQAVPFDEYTRTWPASMPLPPLYEAPTAMRVPSADIAIDVPELSPAASPSMSAPIWLIGVTAVTS